MTWGFVYLCLLIVGLVLAGVTGLLRELPFVPGHRHLVVPAAEQYLSGLNLLGRRLGVTMTAFGLTGLVLHAWDRFAVGTTLTLASVVGLAATAAGLVLIRRPCREHPTGERATVVRDILPNSYGQVKLTHAEGATLLAARSADDATIPAGSEVEVVDCTRSVIIVRGVDSPGR